MQALADIEQVNAREVERPTACCGKMDLQCERVNIVLDDGETLGDCSDFVFGVRWSPEAFVKHAVTVGHPFAFFLWFAGTSQICMSTGCAVRHARHCQQPVQQVGGMAQAIPILAGG